jgi:hypothetical protein
MLHVHFCGQEGLRVKMFERMVLRGKLRCEKLVVAGFWRKLHNEEFHNWYTLHNSRQKLREVRIPRVYRAFNMHGEGKIIVLMCSIKVCVGGDRS